MSVKSKVLILFILGISLCFYAYTQFSSNFESAKYIFLLGEIFIVLGVLVGIKSLLSRYTTIKLGPIFRTILAIFRGALSLLVIMVVIGAIIHFIPAIKIIVEKATPFVKTAAPIVVLLGLIDVLRGHQKIVHSLEPEEES